MRGEGETNVPSLSSSLVAEKLPTTLPTSTEASTPSILLPFALPDEPSRRDKLVPAYFGPTALPPNEERKEELE